VVNHDFEAALALHRPALLRHCYRMLGSFAEAEDLAQDTLQRAWKARAEYRGDASIQRWLYAIATNACLNALAQRKRRGLPQLETAPAGDDYVLGELEAERWITPAADARLFPDASEAAESRELVALAFVALLQRVPARQRAALLLKDVLGWSAEEIAGALGLSVSSVNSAILRARETVARDKPGAEEPAPETLRAFVHAWETRDLDALIALLRRDVKLAMPPHAVWFEGRDAVASFFRSARFAPFLSSLVHVDATRANGGPACVFYVLRDGVSQPHALMVARFLGGRAAEMTTFIGPSYFAGFELCSRPTA
jgi:RNA polymerase sigma-70 factor (ECF subfamily)